MKCRRALLAKLVIGGSALVALASSPPPEWVAQQQAHLHLVFDERKERTAILSIEVSGKLYASAQGGTLELFTIMNLKIAGLPEPPYVLAYVTPEGADTAIGGFLSGVDLTSFDEALTRLKVGAPVEIKFKDEREGRITDLYFQLAD